MLLNSLQHLCAKSRPVSFKNFLSVLNGNAIKISMSDFPLSAVFLATEPTRLTLASILLLSHKTCKKLIIFDETSLICFVSSSVGFISFKIRL